MPEQYVGKWESSKAGPQSSWGLWEGLGAWDDDYDATDILPNVGGGPVGPARAAQEPIGRSEPREAVERVFEVVVERGE
ncbi:hypothetical protein GYMLUDRAFT_50477 [Collybiopsis luxurians FD-317 M1]|uniref:Uncharacterized protein n=1 Tax=Collybiopsis luxurians FD-317 M1 TaxID=944289 RepID=A0A0D0C9W8_9AGAR|nr:hypothetical protein GYMLUDRAFT_50477 [Collybiopsis luxurians FD-317 M1]